VKDRNKLPKGLTRIWHLPSPGILRK